MYRYDAGIQTFDVADIYSNGLAEIILGKAIKKFHLPREEIVVMTKVRRANLITYANVHIQPDAVPWSREPHFEVGIPSRREGPRTVWVRESERAE